MIREDASMKPEQTSKEKIRKMSGIAFSMLILYLILPLYHMIRAFCAGFIAGFYADHDPSIKPSLIGSVIEICLFFKSLFLLVVSIWIIIITFRLLKSLKAEETPFTHANGRLIRNLSFLLIALGLADSIFIFFSNVFITHDYNDPDTKGTVFAAGLVLYCISLVFRYGCELQQESDETL